MFVGCVGGEVGRVGVNGGRTNKRNEPGSSAPVVLLLGEPACQ